jgi:hypothetical protein
VGPAHARGKRGGRRPAGAAETGRARGRLGRSLNSAGGGPAMRVSAPFSTALDTGVGRHSHALQCAGGGWLRREWNVGMPVSRWRVGAVGKRVVEPRTQAAPAAAACTDDKPVTCAASALLVRAFSELAPPAAPRCSARTTVGTSHAKFVVFWTPPGRRGVCRAAPAPRTTRLARLAVSARQTTQLLLRRTSPRRHHLVADSRTSPGAGRRSAPPAAAGGPPPAAAAAASGRCGLHGGSACWGAAARRDGPGTRERCAQAAATTAVPHLT